MKYLITPDLKSYLLMMLQVKKKEAQKLLDDFLLIGNETGIEHTRQQLHLIQEGIDSLNDPIIPFMQKLTK